MREFLVGHPTFWQDPTLESAHVEQEVRIVLAVDGHETVLPLDGRHRPRKTVLDVPKHGSAAENTGVTVQRKRDHHRYLLEFSDDVDRQTKESKVES